MGPLRQTIVELADIQGTGRIPGSAGLTERARATVPSALGNPSQAHTVDVKTAITQITEDHFLIVVGSTAGYTRFTLGALPTELVQTADHLDWEVDTLRMSTHTAL